MNGPSEWWRQEFNTWGGGSRPGQVSGMLEGFRTQGSGRTLRILADCRRADLRAFVVFIEAAMLWRLIHE
jgi:hypothetical protein